MVKKKEPQRTAGQKATHDAAVKAQREAPEVAETWPEPAALPGDGETLTKLLNHLGALTDVGTLATVRDAVEARCLACRVRPVEKKG